MEHHHAPTVVIMPAITTNFSGGRGLADKIQFPGPGDAVIYM